jgi:hypothetical protein
VVYDYDINGAYAYELSQLYDLRRGHWIRSHYYEPEAVYGFCRGLLNVTAPFHPFMIGEGEMKYTPVGSREEYVTKAEWDFIDQYHIGDFDCQDGWWWIPNEGQQQYQIFKGVVNRLWSLRQNADPMMDKILKRIMAGIWGALLQTMGGKDTLSFGERFNPVYGALVESNCRLAVARAVLDNNLYPDHLVNIAVDGIVSSKPIPVDDGKLGGWRLSHKGKAIVVSSGIVGIEEKGGEEDFAITYDKLYSMISANPKARVYRMSKVSPITLGKALAGDRWKEIGNLETVIRTISVKEEGKRLYTKVPKCGGDLLKEVYSSEPWTIGVIRKPGLLATPVEDDSKGLN